MKIRPLLNRSNVVEVVIALSLGIVTLIMQKVFCTKSTNHCFKIAGKYTFHKLKKSNYVDIFSLCLSEVIVCIYQLSAKRDIINSTVHHVCEHVRSLRKYKQVQICQNKSTRPTEQFSYATLYRKIEIGNCSGQ